MRIKNEKSNKINFYYNKKPSEEMLKITKCYLENDKINNNNFKLIKRRNQREIYKVNIGSESYYFKKYSYRSFEKKLKNIFRKSAAYNSFKISNNLIANGISVVTPILAAEIKHNLFTFDSVFITKDFGGTNLQHFLAKEEYSLAEKEEIIISLAELWTKLYKNGYINGDPNLPGVLLKFDDNLKLSFVDVDNFRKKIYLSEKRIIKNLAKFNAHSYSGLDKLNKKTLTKKDRKLFLKYFLKFYNKINISNDDLFQEIKKETKNQLIKWNKSYLLNKN